MKLDGVHHVTCITGDAPQNVEYYTGTLGLRLVKKSVNQDDPTVYHLFYADEQGSPGSDITFFEYPNATRGRAGAGMVHRVVWRVASSEALDFWEQRVGGERGDGFLRFTDPEGLEHELAVVETEDAPLVADHPEISKELALQGFDGVRSFSASPEASRAALEETLAFEPAGDDTWEARGAERGGFYAYDPAPDEPGVMGAGAVHHVAWASTMDDHEEWQRRVAAAGLRPTPIIDRFWFRSIYFREPSGVLFEIATLGPGFDVDEDPEHLGEALVLPPDFEHLRDKLEHVLTPLPELAQAGGTLALVPGWVGPGEIVILLVVALLVFGPKRLPEMGRSLGRGMREFKSSLTLNDDDVVPELPADEPAQTPKPKPDSTS